MPAQRLLPSLFALIAFCLCGCGSTQTIKRPYPQVESALLQRLEGEELGTGPCNVWIGSRELARCLKNIGYVQVSDYTAGQRIQLRRKERYDIGGIGYNELIVDLKRVDDQRTRISVDYSDRAIGFFVIPFAYATPGWIRERKIAKCLVRLEGAPGEADKIPPPLPRLSEASCEWMQGRSCGPPGAELPCDTASGSRLRCICDEAWACGR